MKRTIKFIEALGSAFQIQDDLLSVMSQSYAESRGILSEDIHEGKKTLMIINSIYGESISEKQKKRLVEILHMRTDNEDMISEAISILKESGSIQYAHHTAKNMLGDAWHDLEDTLPIDTAVS